VPNFLGRLQTFLFGAAIGRAASDAITPVLEPVRQQAWEANKVKVLDPATAAEAVAKRFILESEGQDDAGREGVGTDRFGALLRLAQTYPGLGDAAKLSNRQILKPDEVKALLGHHGIPDFYTQPVIDLFNELLSVADVASAVQQGHLENAEDPATGDRILPGIAAATAFPDRYQQAPSPDGSPPQNVPLTTVTSIDPIKEAEHQGVDFARLQVHANLSGLPPGAAETLQMWNRNLVTEEAVDASLREGHLKTKWAQAYKRLRWAVLGASEYANAYVRDWVTKDEMYQGGALTGHTPDQMDLLYKNRGRPLAPVQAYTAWAREAPHPEIPGEPKRTGTFDYTDFEQAIRRSDVQTWYAPVLWHDRWAYPPLFQLGRLAQAGALPEDRVRTILKYERYEQQDIDALVKFWYTPSATSTRSTPTSKAQTQLWTALHKSYVDSKTSASQATTTLAEAGVPAGQIPGVLAAWDAEKALVRRELTTKQILGAPSTDPNYGTDAQKQIALQELGFSPDDILVLLGE